MTGSHDLKQEFIVAVNLHTAPRHVDAIAIADGRSASGVRNIKSNGVENAVKKLLLNAINPMSRPYRRASSYSLQNLLF
ncbi:hypothetical protein ELH30_08505 [Rhizobium ruizarguesonis]|nr:hypothetical protein ELH30_08505 [Rhizobium ruizarguesonis]